MLKKEIAGTLLEEEKQKAVIRKNVEKRVEKKSETNIIFI